MNFALVSHKVTAMRLITRREYAQVHRLSWKTGQLISWTSKVLQVDRDRAAEIVKLAANSLANNGWLRTVRVKNVGELLMINTSSILLSVPMELPIKSARNADWSTTSKRLTSAQDQNARILQRDLLKITTSGLSICEVLKILFP